MKIKTSRRVVYAHNPIVEVVCQVRFSRLLALDTHSPVKFQEQFAGSDYPTLTVDFPPSIQISWNQARSPQLSSDVATASPVYHFASKDGLSKVSLSSEFIAFSCQTYSSWEIFRTELMRVVTAFMNIYPAALPTRVGLRYRDLILREALGLQGTPWDELLSPLVGGIFNAKSCFDSDSVDERSIAHLGAQVGLSLDDCELLLHTALLRSSDGAEQQAFLIDSDFYMESPKHNLSFVEIEKSLEPLHTSAGAIFHHCIKEKLHDALGPLPI